jgi:hypothetical protein
MSRNEVTRLRELETENAWFKTQLKFGDAQPTDNATNVVNVTNNTVETHHEPDAANEAMRLLQVELENARLKKLLAEAYLYIEALKESGGRR